MLRGRLIHRDGPRGVLDVAGVGYEIFAPSRTLDAWAGGDEVVVHVSTQVREDAIQLYGFGSDVDRRAFVVLLGISGFGPKIALQTLDLLLPLLGTEAVREVNEMALECQAFAIKQGEEHRCDDPAQHQPHGASLDRRRQRRHLR